MPDFTHIPNRTFWPREPDDLRPFISANIGVLAALLGIDLIEVRYPTFRRKIGKAIIDMLAIDQSDGSNVVIEIQVGPADKDHLDRLEKYHRSHNAPTIIWIAESFNEEIVATLRDLNRRLGATFRVFAIALRVRRYDDGRLEPYFEVVVRPEDVVGSATGLPNVATCVGELHASAELWATLLTVYPAELRRSHQWQQDTRYRKETIAGWRVTWDFHGNEIRVWLRPAGRSPRVDLLAHAGLIEARLGVGVKCEKTGLMALKRRAISAEDPRDRRAMADWLFEQANTYEAVLRKARATQARCAATEDHMLGKRRPKPIRRHA